MSRQAKIRKAVIPAAGLGTRFLPATKSQPKEMFPVFDKPLIQYSVEEARSAGIRSIAIVMNPKKSVIQDHFTSNFDLEELLAKNRERELLGEVRKISRLAEFHFICQKEPLGLGHAILTAQRFVGHEPFAVLNPDNIYDCQVPCIAQLIRVFAECHSSVIVLGRVDQDETKKYGIVKTKRQVGERIFEIGDLAEKPGPGKALSDLAVLGRYVFTPHIFDAIRETPPGWKGEIQITDAIKKLLDDQPVYGYLFEGKRYDAGDKWGYVEATLELARKRPEFQDKLREWTISFPSKKSE